MRPADRAKPWIAALQPYQPGKPVEELERELGIRDAVKLASNENPLGPSPRALEAVRAELESTHRYPDGVSFRLRRKLAGRLGVEEAQLVFGTGADELLELAAKAFLGPGDEAVFAWPSFAMYPIVVRGAGATAVNVPLREDRVHDLAAMAEAVTTRCRMLIVCNPNNPTGTSVGREELERLLASLPEDLLVILDEAYVEYARRSDFPDAIELLAGRPGTLVLRTFSKVYGLAGLRVGYGVMDAGTAGVLERARHPFNVNRLAEAAACAALDDTEHVERTLRVTHEGIELLSRELAALGIEVTPSDANFLLARTGPDCYEALLREGVIVRPLAGAGLPEHVRISIGTPEENQRLLEAMRKLRGAPALRQAGGGRA